MKGVEDIENIIQLLRIPFINAITEIDENKFVFTLEKKDLSNTFFQISQFIIEGTTSKREKDISDQQEVTIETSLSEENESRNYGTKYFKWQLRGNSIFATARKENPYEHSCPIDHFKTIITKIIEAFRNQTIINNETIYKLLSNQELSPNRIFKGRAEEYKIRMILGIIELEAFTKWTGSLRPIEYILDKPLEDLIKWSESIARKD